MLQLLDERITSVLNKEMALQDDVNDAIDHGVIVCNVAALIAKELGCDDDFCKEIAIAGTVHDIGKLQLGQYLYGRNQGALAIEEIKYVRMHPVLGFETLQERGGFSDLVLQGVRFHHENYDGTGYPNNLKGEAIPLAARILRVCDVYAALISERPYRAAFDSATAVEMMIDEVRHFDMKIFLSFLSVVHSEEIKEVLEYSEKANVKIRERHREQAEKKLVMA